ncbi:MAG: DNA-processing protein DprA [Saprospiraceae bacterium]
MHDFLETTYWISIAHLPRWTIERINNMVIRVLHESGLRWNEFFEMEKKGLRELFAFSDKELADLENAKKDLPRIAFIAEQLHNEGFQVIPLNSGNYPPVLKENLKTKGTPPVIYTFGRTGLLQEDALAIVGSRNAGDASLTFTDFIAKKAVKDFKVVVSGFAKGVDKQALDSTLEAHGKSIIVLPQGVLTFQSGFKKYYEPIVSGDVLVFSTFFPKAGWEVGLAMARNTYIYGLAKEIYVAESDSSGGTWQGAMDGLTRKRSVYVRVPEVNEKNANLKLIDLGAIPVNAQGLPVDVKRTRLNSLFNDTENLTITNEPETEYDNPQRNIEKDILNLLQKDAYTSKEILLALKLEWDSRKLTNFLKNNPNVKTIPGKPNKFELNKAINLSLFNYL